MNIEYTYNEQLKIREYSKDETKIITETYEKPLIFDLEVGQTSYEDNYLSIERINNFTDNGYLITPKQQIWIELALFGTKVIRISTTEPISISSNIYRITAQQLLEEVEKWQS